MTPFLQSAHTGSEQEKSQPFVGLIPAAGIAKRLGLSACSKEILPVNTGTTKTPIQVAGEFLLKQMVRAGCQKIFFILRLGKWDIIEYFNHGAAFGCPIGYLIMDAPYGPPFTLSQAIPFIEEVSVLTGFPDILIDPPDACEQVVRHLNNSDADVVLATFPAGPAGSCDLAEVDDHSRVVKIVPKEYHPVWRADSKTWLIAAWRYSFTAFFANVIDKLKAKVNTMPLGNNPEWPLGIVLMEALKAGINVKAVHFPQGRFLDIGTPERLAQAPEFTSKSNDQ